MTTASSTARSAAITAFLLGAFALTLLALAPSASAASSCAVGGAYEVDDDFAVDNPLTCHYKALTTVLLLPLTSGDVINLHNGTYAGEHSVSVSGITIVGESQANVLLTSNSSASTLTIAAADVTVRNLTLNSDIEFALHVQGSSAKLSWLTLRAPINFGCFCEGSDTTLTNITISGSNSGLLATGARLTATDITIDLLDASTWGVAEMGGSATFTRLTVTGAPAGIGLRIEGSGQSFTLAESRFTGQHQGVSTALTGGGRLDITDLTITGCRSGIDIESNGPTNIARALIQDTASVGAAISVDNSGPVTIVNLTVSRAHDGLTDNGAGALTLIGSSFDTITSAAVSITGAGANAMSELTLSNIGYAGIVCVASCQGVFWDQGTVTGPTYGVQQLAPSTFTVSHVAFSTSTYGVFLGSDTGSVVVSNCTFLGMNEVGVHLGSGTNSVIEDNHFDGNGLFASAPYTRIAGNTFVNSTYGLDVDVRMIDSPLNYYDFPPTNLIEGRPARFYINASDFTVPTDTSMLILVNTSRVVVDGLTTASTYFGVRAVNSRDLTIANSRLEAVYAISVSGVTNMTVTNVTMGGPGAVIGFGGDNLDGLLIDGVNGDGNNGVNFVTCDLCSNATYRNLDVSNWVFWIQLSGGSQVLVEHVHGVRPAVTSRALGVNGVFDLRVTDVDASGPLPAAEAFRFDTVTRANVSDINLATALGVLVTGSQNVTLARVNIEADRRQAFSTIGSPNLTIYSSSFVSTASHGATFGGTGDFFSYGSTYTAAQGSRAISSSKTDRLTFWHNNFYGLVYATTGTFVWYGNYPVGGNYYDEWPGAQDSAGGPGQDAGGPDGISDVPYSFVSAPGLDAYPLVEPWAPYLRLKSPSPGALIPAGTELVFDASTFFDTIAWVETPGGRTGLLGSPVWSGGATPSISFVINTTGWPDGTHTVVVTASDPAAPAITLAVSVIIYGNGLGITAVPQLGSRAVLYGTVITVTFSDPLFASSYYAWGSDPITTGNDTELAFDTSAFGAGNTFTLLLGITDQLGNTRNVVWMFYLDSVAPLISGANTPPCQLPGNDDPRTFSVADDFGVKGVTYELHSNGTKLLSGALSNNGRLYLFATGALEEAWYQLYMTATDYAGATDTFSESFCIDGTAPDVSGIVDAMVDEGVLYTFPGRAVTDLDTNLVFSWAFTPPGAAAMVTLDGVAPTWVFATPGRMTVNFTVRDSLNHEASGSYEIWVVDTSPPDTQAPLVTLPETATAFKGEVVGLEPSLATDDSGLPLRFTWTCTDGPNQVTIAGRELIYRFSNTGTFRCKLDVEDAAGNVASAHTDITVKGGHAGPNSPPVFASGGFPPLAITGNNTGHVVAIGHDYLTDADDDLSNMTFTVDATGPFTARIIVLPDGSRAILITSTGVGNGTVTLHADDGSGGTASTTFSVTSTAAPGGGGGGGAAGSGNLLLGFILGAAIAGGAVALLSRMRSRGGGGGGGGLKDAPAAPDDLKVKEKGNRTKSGKPSFGGTMIREGSGDASIGPHEEGDPDRPTLDTLDTDGDAVASERSSMAGESAGAAGASPDTGDNAMKVKEKGNRTKMADGDPIPDIDHATLGGQTANAEGPSPATDDTRLKVKEKGNRTK